MDLEEALAVVRTRRLAENVSALAVWQKSKMMLGSLHETLASTPVSVVGDFYFEHTDQRVVIGRTEAIVIDADDTTGMPPIRGPIQIGSWRFEKGRLVFYFWGGDCHAYQVDDVAGALLVVAELILQHRDREAPILAHEAIAASEDEAKWACAQQ